MSRSMEIFINRGLRRNITRISRRTSYVGRVNLCGNFLKPKGKCMRDVERVCIRRIGVSHAQLILVASITGSNRRAKYMKSRNIYPSLPSILRNNPTRPSILYNLRPIFIFNHSARIPLLVVICTTWRNKQRLLACTREQIRESDRSESSPVRPR